MNNTTYELSLRHKASKVVLFPFGVLFALFGVLVIHSWFDTGSPQTGALQCFGLNALLLGVPAFVLPAAKYRHVFLSRWAVCTSLGGIVIVFLLKSKLDPIRAAKGQPPDVAWKPTLVVFAVLMLLSVGYWAWVTKNAAASKK